MVSSKYANRGTALHNLELLAEQSREFHPDYIHHVLVENGRNYNKDTFTNSAFKKIIGSSLINLEGDAWLQRREVDLTHAGFAPIAELRGDKASFETWSQFVLEELENAN